MPEQQNPEQQLEYLKELRRKYEEALSNAQKTGDYSEAEKLKEELEARLSALEAQFQKPEPVTSSIEKVEKGETAYERAKELMKEDFFGYNAYTSAFGYLEWFKPYFDTVPYSEAELERAKKIGEILIIRIDPQNILTMEKMQELTNNGPIDEATHKRFIGADLYSKERVREGWALVSKDLIVGSGDMDYIAETIALRDHLKSFGVLSEKELQECTDDKLQKLRDLLKSDYTGNIEFVTQKLGEMLINKNHRRTPVEAMYDWILRGKDKNKNLLDDNCEWTNAYYSAFVTYVGYDKGSLILGDAMLSLAEPNRGVVSVR